MASDKLDLLYGIKAIASHLGVTARQAGHLHEKGQLPTFHMGARIAARKAELDATLTDVTAIQARGPRRYRPRAGRDAKPPMATLSANGLPDSLLIGFAAIGGYLGVTPSDVDRLEKAREIPTFIHDGCVCAGTAALQHWRSIKEGC